MSQAVQTWSVWRSTALIAGVCLLPGVLMALGVDLGTRSYVAGVDGLAAAALPEVANQLLRGSFTHTLLEWTAVCTAFFVGILAFSQFKLSGRASLPIIGIALICAGAMDAFHTFAADRLIEAKADNRDLVPFTWAICRFFNGTIQLIGVALFTTGIRKGRGSSAMIVATSAAFILISYVIVHLCAASEVLPQTMFPDSMVTRPYDLYPLAPFLLSAFFVFPRYLRQNPSPFAYSLLLSLIPQISVQLYMAFGSTGLHDAAFNVAHGLKAFSYAVPMIGLLMEIQHVYRESEKLSIIADTTDDGVVVMDPSGEIEWVNSAFSELTEFSAEEAMRKKLGTLLESSELTTLIQKVREERAGLRAEVPTSIRSGAAGAFEVEVQPVLNASGELSRLISIQRDVTERKEARARLEESVKVMDAARLESERANRSKGEFLANMSHEIRTPLNGVMGMSALLSDTELSEEQSEYVRMLRVSGESLLSVINDILDFSKIEAGDLSIETLTFDLRECASSVIELLVPQATDAGLELGMQVADDVPEFVVGDDGRIRQILVNLIGNAIKFTKQGSVRLAITCDERAAGQAQLRFCVADSGIGLTSDQIDQIFERFTQADSSTTREFGGTGLGLSICRQLTELMGGSIGVNSEPAVGSEFWFSLSLPIAQAPEKRAETAEAPAGQRFEARVLVVEDNPVNQKVAAVMLRKLGCCVDMAANGREGVRAVRSLPYALVFMDCQMPEMDGFEATREIRGGVDSSQVPIIAMTANAMQGDRERCIAAGMNDYVAKPINSEALRGLLARWLPVDPTEA